MTQKAPNKKPQTLHRYVYNDMVKIPLFIDYEQFISDTMKLLGTLIDVDDPDETMKLIARLDEVRMRLVFVLVNAKALQDQKIGEAWRAKPTSHGATSRNKAEVDEETYHFTYLRNLLDEMLIHLDKKMSYARAILKLNV